MALVDSRGYNLNPRMGISGKAVQGLAQLQQFGQQNIARDQQAEIRGLLAQQQGQGAPAQQAAPSMQVDPATGQIIPQAAQPAQPRVLSLQEKKAAALKVNPELARKMFKDAGIDDASQRAEASRFAAQLENTPFADRAGLINARIQKLDSEGRDYQATSKLLNATEQEQNQAALGIQLADLSTKERFATKTAQARGRSATQKAFSPVTIINPATGEKKLVSPTVDNLTGKATLSPFDMPEGFKIAEETDQEERSADLAAKIKEEQEKAHIKKTTSQDIKFMERIGAEGAGIYSTLQKAAQDASRFIPRLNGLKKLAQEVRTGTGANISMIAKRTLGIDSASNMEVLNAKLGELAQDILNQQTGTKTDFDFQNAVRQSASLGKTKEANAMLIEALIRRQQEAVDFGNQARKVYKKEGVKGILDMRYVPPTTTGSESPTTPQVGGIKFLGFE